MKNKFILLILLSLILSSCINNREKEEKTETNSGEIIEIIEETNSGKLDTIETQTGTGEEIITNSGTLDSEKNIEIIKEKETLKEIIKDEEVKTENTGAITTDKLLDDISENYDKEIEDEILKLFE